MYAEAFERTHKSVYANFAKILFISKILKNMGQKDLISALLNFFCRSTAVLCECSHFHHVQVVLYWKD